MNINSADSEDNSSTMTTHTYELYRRVVALNNRGVALLHDNHISSIALFRSALETFAGHADYLSDACCAPGTLASAPSALRNDVSANLRTQDGGNVLVQTMDDSVMNISVSPFEHSPLIVNCAFLRPLNLDPTANMYSQDQLANMCVATAIVLFNMAVVYHMCGLQDEDDCNDRFAAQDQSIVTAQRLYLKAISLLESVPATTRTKSEKSSAGRAVLDLLTMALHNNLAQIASFFCQDFCLSQTHCQRLLACCVTVRPEEYEEEDPETAAILAWHISTFLFHIFVLHQPPSSSFWHTAASAA